MFTLDNHISDFDFNPTGEKIATIDKAGNFLIADVDAGQCSFHLRVEDSKGNSTFLSLAKFI